MCQCGCKERRGRQKESGECIGAWAAAGIVEMRCVEKMLDAGGEDGAFGSSCLIFFWIGAL